METALAMGTGWLLALCVAMRQMWPDSWLYDDAFTAAFRIGVGFLVGVLALSGIARRRVTGAKAELQEEVEQLRCQRDQWMRSTAVVLRMGIELGTEAGHDKARREYLRSRRLRAS